MKAAKFPSTKSLATFDFLARPSVNKMMVLELARCSFIDERENVLFIGNPGTGKSHLATAIAAEACAKGYNVRFFRVTELVTMLIEAKDQRVLARLKTQLSKLDLLVLDELGYVPASKVGAELLFDVIATAYERSSIMVTTNQPALRKLDRSSGIRTTHRGHARPVDASLQDHRDEGRELPTSGRHETVPNQKGLRESGVSHVLEADLGDNHVLLFSTRGCCCFRCVFTTGQPNHEPACRTAHIFTQRRSSEEFPESSSPPSTSAMARRRNSAG
jgi:hypothetical protein